MKIKPLKVLGADVIFKNLVSDFYGFFFQSLLVAS